MALVVPNFARTTLRASITPAQNQLALAIGSGPYFEIGAGNYMYLTIEDGQSVEIVRYNCLGPVVNDMITVVRGEDGTTPKAFPAGACVKVAWNVAQMQDLINQTFISIFNSTVLPPNTIQVQSVPSAPPPLNVYYAIWTQNKRFWYWDGAAWVEIGNARDSVLAGYGDPSGIPIQTVSFYVDLNTGALWYWNGSAWMRVGGQNIASTAEHWVRSSAQGLNHAIPQGGVAYALGNVPIQERYRMYPNGNDQKTILVLQPQGGFQRVTLKDSAALRMTVSLVGRVGTTGNEVTAPGSGTVLLTLTNSPRTWEQWGDAMFVQSGYQPSIYLSCTTDVLTFPTGTFFDANITLTAMPGQEGLIPYFWIRQLSYGFQVIEAGKGPTSLVNYMLANPSMVTSGGI